MIENLQKSSTKQTSSATTITNSSKITTTSSTTSNSIINNNHNSNSNSHGHGLGLGHGGTKNGETLTKTNLRASAYHLKAISATNGVSKTTTAANTNGYHKTDLMDILNPPSSDPANVTPPSSIASNPHEVFNVDEIFLLSRVQFENGRSLGLKKSKSCFEFHQNDFKIISPPSLQTITTTTTGTAAGTVTTIVPPLSVTGTTLNVSNSSTILNTLNELDRQYQSSRRETDLCSKKRNTWPNVLKTIEMKKKFKSFIPPNLKKSFSIFLTDTSLTLPLTANEEEEQTKCKAFMGSNWCLCLIVPTILVCVLVVIAYFSSSYMQTLMMWIEKQNSYLVLGILSFLYIVMCFPISFGFFLLKIATGYLYGFVIGIVIAICNSMLGVAIAHFVLRHISNRSDCKKLIKNKTALAILRVINGPRAFRIVLFTRFTPLPTGIQNLIFSLCNIKWYIYLSATLIGMVPSEVLTVYLGSGFRSMQDVLSTNGCIWPTYVLVGFGVLFGFILMTWIVMKAKAELRNMIANDQNINNNNTNITYTSNTSNTDMSNNVSTV